MSPADRTPQAERWEQVQALLADVLELPPARRSAFLDHACEDPELRVEVESLISASEESEDYFGDLADRAGMTLSSDTREEGRSRARHASGGRRLGVPDLVGQRIGQYHVLGSLGVGGMASVYLAEREGEGFVQRVALKVVSTRLSDPLIQRRSNEERRILARLEHHGIARLIDGGVTREGFPFYAMEYVDGKDLLRHSDDLRLTVTDRIRLFLRVLVPVQYAHERLVVHCDLKPSNIFVTEQGDVKLLDFGVARLIDPNSAGAREGGLWFTPAYASPEQVRREPPGTASDVYSLGVLLYELLTGHRPYQFVSDRREDIARTVGTEVPVPPSRKVAETVRTTVAGERVQLTPDQIALARRSTPKSLAKRLEGDLDAIVLKALAKDPADRYHTAEQFAADLRRHLSHEPLASVPPTFRYRAGKFVRRNRGVLTAASVVLLALAAGTGAALWQASKATRAAAVAAEEAEKARMVADLMSDLFRLSDPSETLGDTITARDLLDRGTQRIETEFGDQPVVQAELLTEVAKVYGNMALFGRAEPLVERALALRSAEFGDESLEVSESLLQLGSLRLDVSDPVRALPLLERAVAIREAAAPRPDQLLVEAWSTLGWAVRARGEHARAAELFRRALDEQQSIDPSPASVADLMFGLASSYHDDGMLSEADSVFNAILSRADRDARPTPNAVAALGTVGMVRRLREQYREADPILRSALEMSERLYGPEHPTVIEARQEYALNRWALGDWEEAEELLRRALRSAERVLGPEHERTAGIGESLAYVLEDEGRFDEAVVYQQIALEEKVRRHQGQDHPGVVSSLSAVGRALALAGRLSEARSYLDRADAMIGRLGTDPSVYSIGVERARGLVAMAEGQHEISERHFLRAIGLCDELLPRASHRFATGAKVEYAGLLIAEGRLGEAADLLVEAEALLVERVGDPHPLVSEARALLRRARSG
jgi:serine/threonine-protein kinase